nr:E3 ubiquitin-protein ligase UPL5 [Ipomoea batatas]
MTSNLEVEVTATAKLKLDEYFDDAFTSECLIPAAVTMRKDHAGPTSAPDSAQVSDLRSTSAAAVSTSRSSASFAAASSSSSAFASFSVLPSTKIPVFEQQLIYRGKQLQCDQTLAECGILKDVILKLVGRMRSTSHPQAWQFIDDMVWKIFELCKNKTLQSSA